MWSTAPRRARRSSGGISGSRRPAQREAAVPSCPRGTAPSVAPLPAPLAPASGCRPAVCPAAGSGARARHEDGARGGQRQASVLEPRQAEPQACRDTQQQELEPAQVLASIQALQLDLDFCRGTNRERLVQLQQQERAVEQKHQDLVFLMQHYRAVMGKDQKDEAVQTEVTSYVATHSHSDTSYNILKERAEPLEQVSAGSPAATGPGPAGAGRQHVAVLLTQVVVGAEMMHCRQKRAAEERRYRAQDTQLGRAAVRSSAEEGGVGKEGASRATGRGLRGLEPAAGTLGSTLSGALVGSPGPARAGAHGLPRRQKAAARRHQTPKPWDGVGGGNAGQPPLSQAAQAPAQQLPAPSTLQRAEEQPCLCPGKGVQHEASCEVEAELQALQKEAASGKAEQAQSRELAARLQAELSQWQWKQQVTLEQALRHMHAAAHAEEKLQRSQEQLQALREQLGAQEEQSQGLWHSLARLQDELGATQAREQQSLQQLSGAKETIQGLQQEAASNRKHLAELLQRVQDMATLQAELAQAQQEKAKQEEKIAAYEEQRQQLHWELRKLQGSQEQSKQEAFSLQERLQELSSRAQRWQQLHRDSERALAMREEELVVCKVELAFLKEELSKAMEQVQDGHRQHHSPRAGTGWAPSTGNDRSWPTGQAEVGTGQGTAYCRSQATKGGGSGSGSSSSRAEHHAPLKPALFAPLLEVPQHETTML
ncbi:hypothetical protein QYF61_023739 [Mycteria americana]|uniref:Polyamine-modulated factor 1-binding protein 1 n=1 Tax=Mycteria americana TaxID=33587 RepID=A0AAN7NFH3_MYCAM|nr:hypothetical protein QYF61_023739 [Mycteria americana]